MKSTCNICYWLWGHYKEQWVDETEAVMADLEIVAGPESVLGGSARIAQAADMAVVLGLVYPRQPDAFGQVKRAPN
ncbi:hypothetical protein FRC12_011302 [Ceratobasidium sp. 428]|nr:hypothetical protein FRC12_011302 [Ceratobasidium sp. 428]